MCRFNCIQKLHRNFFHLNAFFIDFFLSFLVFIFRTITSRPLPRPGPGRAYGLGAGPRKTGPRTANKSFPLFFSFLSFICFSFSNRLVSQKGRGRPNRGSPPFQSQKKRGTRIFIVGLITLKFEVNIEFRPFRSRRWQENS